MTDQEHTFHDEDLTDHASALHQGLSKAVMDALEEHGQRDPHFCLRCALTSIVIAKVAQLKYLVDHGSEHERAEYQPLLDAALRERLELEQDHPTV